MNDHSYMKQLLYVNSDENSFSLKNLKIFEGKYLKNTFLVSPNSSILSKRMLILPQPKPR